MPITRWESTGAVFILAGFMPDLGLRIMELLSGPAWWFAILIKVYG